MKYKSINEAVELANDSIYGLSGSVYGPKEEAAAVAKRIRGGAICLNDASLQAYMMEAENEPFGESAYGRSRMGISGLMRYFRTQAIISNNSGKTRSIHHAGEAGVQP